MNNGILRIKEYQPAAVRGVLHLISSRSELALPLLLLVDLVEDPRSPIELPSPFEVDAVLVEKDTGDSSPFPFVVTLLPCWWWWCCFCLLLLFILLFLFPTLLKHLLLVLWLLLLVLLLLLLLLFLMLLAFGSLMFGGVFWPLVVCKWLRLWLDWIAEGCTTEPKCPAIPLVVATTPLDVFPVASLLQIDDISTRPLGLRFSLSRRYLAVLSNCIYKFMAF